MSLGRPLKEEHPVGTLVIVIKAASLLSTLPWLFAELSYNFSLLLVVLFP